MRNERRGLEEVDAGVASTPGILIDGRLIKTWNTGNLLQQIVAERTKAAAGAPMWQVAK